MKTTAIAYTRQYGWAVFSVVVAVGLRRLLDPWLGEAFPFATVFFAILLTAWRGGFKPALAAVIMGAAACDYFLLAPRGSFNVAGPQLIGFGLFLAAGLGIALLGGVMQRERRRAESQAAALRLNNEQLEARVRERTAELQQKTGTLEAEITARRLMEAQLRLLQTCVDRVNDIILITEAEPQDLPGPRIVYVNDAFLRRTGYTRAEAIGNTPRMLQGPKTSRRELDRIRAALREWQPIRVELINYTKAGEAFWIELEIVPVADATGWFTHWVAVERDITERKQTEAGVAQLAAIVQSSDDAIIGKNLDGIVTSWNAGAEKIFGYPADEMTGQPIRRLIPDGRQHEEDDILAKIRRGESIRHYDTVRQRKDGRRLEVSVTISPIKDAGANIIGVSKVARDITERKQVETALALERHKLTAAFENTDMGFVLFDIRGGGMTMNQAALRFHGFASVAEMLTKIEDYVADWELHYPDGRRMPFSEWPVSRAIAGDFVQNYEAHLHNVKTNYKWIGSYTTKPVRNRGGEVSLILLTVLDITERKRAEAAMQESEARFRTMANSMVQLAWIARADGFIFWYNQRWYEYTGTTPGQMEGWGWQRMHDPAVLPSVMEKWQAAIQSGEPFEMAFPLRGADGRFRNFLTRGQPLKDATGRVVQWCGTNTDVDELKRSEEKVRQLNTELEQRVAERTAQLEQANKELESFSYSVSHDLRAPLRAVSGFAAMVMAEHGGQLPAAGQHYLERIQRGAGRMGLLIDDLLAFSRLSRQAVQRQPVDMNRLVQAAWEELKPQWAGRAVEIRAAPLPPGQGDPELLRQVWINLLGNAVKYTAGRTPAVIETGGLTQNGETVYFVRDNGAGFEMQFAHKLFGVFQRLHRADEFEGTGVGLAIVQRIIRRHGGRVWAQAALNRGATFYFTLEADEPSTQHEHQPRSGNPAGRGQSGRPRPDALRAAEGETGQSYSDSAGWSGGPGLHLRRGAVCGARDGQGAEGDSAGFEAAQGGRLGSIARPEGGSPHQGHPRGDADLFPGTE